jgi:hypothetical protein
MAIDLVKVYREILHSLNVVDDADGLCSVKVGDQLFPISIKDKRLVLPTPEVLRNGDWRSLVAFHPMAENVMRGESPVIGKLRSLIGMRLSHTLIQLLHGLVEITSNASSHSKLPPKLADLLSTMPDADAKTAAALEKILESTEARAPEKFISIYLKRPGTLHGEKFSRLAVVTFPFAEEFEDAEPTVFGVKLRKKDYEGLEKLFHFIVPGCDTYEKYSAGSNSMYAPVFDALLRAYVNVAEQLNSVTKAYSKHLVDAKSLLIDLSWAAEMSDIKIYRDLIPTLDGNDGDLPKDVQEHLTGQPQVPQVGASSPMQAEPVRSSSVFSTAPPAPAPAPAPEVHQHKAAGPSKGGLKWEEVERAQIENARRLLPQPPPVPQLSNYAAPLVQAFNHQQPQNFGPPPGYVVDPRYAAPPPAYQQQPPQPIPGQFVGYDQWQRPVDAWGNPCQTMPPPQQAYPVFQQQAPQMYVPGGPDWLNQTANVAPQPGYPNGMVMPQNNGRQPSFGLGVTPQSLMQNNRPNVGVGYPVQGSIPQQNGWGVMGQVPAFRHNSV